MYETKCFSLGFRFNEHQSVKLVNLRILCLVDESSSIIVNHPPLLCRSFRNFKNQLYATKIWSLSFLFPTPPSLSPATFSASVFSSSRFKIRIRGSDCFEAKKRRRGLLERFSIEYRKTKTKVITLANHSWCKQRNEPIRVQSK